MRAVPGLLAVIDMQRAFADPGSLWLRAEGLRVSARRDRTPVV
ncbi:hypothetical protein [Streptomyces sp. NPDC027717]